MKNKNIFKLLDEIQEEENNTPQDKSNRILIIDGLNLFLRNFAALNYINNKGIHIGGLGGFLRSLGSYIKHLHPTSIYIIFDGLGSSLNRKNLIPEYKSGRNQTRITNWDSFDNLTDEQESKTNQIERLIYYLKYLPINIISIDKVEADDVIAFLSSKLTEKKKNKVFIVSADNDFLQLVNNNITVYRPIEKEFITPEVIKEKYNVYPYNFLIYKTLMGDSSDKVGGIKGLGKTKFPKLFPELIGNKELTLDEIYNICCSKIEDHVIYARAVQNFDELKKAYKIMNLKNPMLDNLEKKLILEAIDSSPYKLDPANFLRMYNEDGLGNILKNVDYWIKECFDKIDRYNRSKIN